MRQLLILAALAAALAAVTACGSSARPAAGPLPPDPKPAAAAADKSAAPAQPEAPAPAETKPPAPTGPGEAKIPAPQVTVKLVSDGKGKKQALRYTPRAGAKQAVEVAMDFAGNEDSEASIIPTIVLIGEAETRALDKDGAADYALTVTGTDARAVTGAAVPVDQFKTVLGALVGLTISGRRGANGSSGELALRIEHPPQHADDALGLLRLTFPALPALPIQPVGVGAKWQAVAAIKLADKLDVTQITEYELLAHDGATWKIKGSTKVTGADQQIEGQKISAISGTGTSETTISDGALYPSHKAQIETKFTASDSDKTRQYLIKIGGAVTPK
jgi:hypothetical protein